MGFRYQDEIWVMSNRWDGMQVPTLKTLRNDNKKGVDKETYFLMPVGEGWGNYDNLVKMLSLYQNPFKIVKALKKYNVIIYW